jgi:monofunctional biosynthetic peptidoglycan transglycosylase
MTSLKGTSSEPGGISPAFDVLTGPPVSRPEETQAPASESHDVPAADLDRQFLIEAPPPPEMVEIAPESAPRSDGVVEDVPILAREAPLVLPMVLPVAASSGGPLHFVSFVRAEVICEPAPADAAPADAAIAPAEIPPLAPEPLAEPVTTIVDAPYLSPEPMIAPVPADVSANLAPTFIPPPPLPVTVAPPPLPEIPVPAPSPTFVAPELASAVAAPSAVAFELPTRQPAAPPAPPPSIAIPTAKPTRPRWRMWVRRAILTTFGLATGYAVLVLVLIVVYRTVDPPRSTVMIGVALSGQSIDYEPVPLSSVSTYLLRAVVTSEDARFCRHGGVDWGALAEAIQDSRGGSTITMQVAKNLFLWPSRSYVRKAIEIPLALLIDFAWPKRRVLEVYLNIAEWGPGIFGAEAAAQYHFNKSASRLTQNEATLLAASLPNPIARDAGDPGRVTELLASRLRARMANSDAYVGCLGIRPMPRAEPERAPKSAPAAAARSAPKAQPWQTKTEPAKPPAPFNPWQN